MRVVVVTPPTPVVSYAEAVARLKLAGGSGEQPDVESMIAAATDMLDVGTGWLGRAIGEQRLELRCEGFGRCGALKLPFPPVAAVVSVKYLDTAGAEQTISSSDYELMGEELVSAHNVRWPVPLDRREAVRVRYDAGYDVVPASIKNAILLAVGDMYRFRETIAARDVSQLPSAASIENLLGPIRIFR